MFNKTKKTKNTRKFNKFRLSKKFKKGGTITNFPKLNVQKGRVWRTVGVNKLRTHPLPNNNLSGNRNNENNENNGNNNNNENNENNNNTTVFGFDEDEVGNERKNPTLNIVHMGKPLNIGPIGKPNGNNFSSLKITSQLQTESPSKNTPSDTFIINNISNSNLSEVFRQGKSLNELTIPQDIVKIIMRLTHIFNKNIIDGERDININSMVLEIHTTFKFIFTNLDPHKTTKIDNYQSRSHLMLLSFLQLAKIFNIYKINYNLFINTYESLKVKFKLYQNNRINTVYEKTNSNDINELKAEFYVFSNAYYTINNILSKFKKIVKSGYLRYLLSYEFVDLIIMYNNNAFFLEDHTLERLYQIYIDSKDRDRYLNYIVSIKIILHEIFGFLNIPKDIYIRFFLYYKYSNNMCNILELSKSLDSRFDYEEYDKRYYKYLFGLMPTINYDNYDDKYKINNKHTIYNNFVNLFHVLSYKKNKISCLRSVCRTIKRQFVSTNHRNNIDRGSVSQITKIMSFIDKISTDLESDFKKQIIKCETKKK